MSKSASPGDPSGLLVVDKPSGVTSHDVVAAVRSMLHTRHVGHAGTLDPMATGVLVVGFGHATRLLGYIVDHHKTYEATIRLGQTTTTDDADGDVTSCIPAMLGRAQIEQVIAEHLVGTIQQVPSSYSAIKVNGKRAYDLARAGQKVELVARDVTVDEFRVLSVTPTTVRCVGNAQLGDVVDANAALPGKCIQADGSDDFTGVARAYESVPVTDVSVRVSCSAGTYIRSLGRDLGELLGVGGHLTRLRRLRVGNFCVDGPNVVQAHAEPHAFTDREGRTVTRNRVALQTDRDGLLASSMTMFEAAQSTLPTVRISEDEARDLRYGRCLHRSVETVSAAYLPQTGEVVALIAPVDVGKAKPQVVFPAL